MNILPSGSYDVFAETGMPDLISSFPSTSSVSYTKSTFVFVQNYLTEVDYITNAQSLSVTEKTFTQVLPDLSCSLSSSTSIVFSLGSLNNVDVLTWVSIDANTGILTITSPEVEKDIKYSFYVNAAITGITQQIQKPIELTITNWDTCGSETAKALSITLQSIVGITVLISMIVSMLNVTSSSSLWSLINQVHLFFLLLLVRAYIPDDIKTVITGFKIILNPPNYFKFNAVTAYNSIFDNFDFDLSNNSLNYIGVNSDSSVYNTAPFFLTLLAVIVFHLFVMIFKKLLSKCSFDWWSCFAKIFKMIFEKWYNMLTFGYYIRAILEMNHYLLICSVYEIYIFNFSQPIRIVSLMFAILILIGLILTAIWVFCLSITSYTIDEENHNKLGEFFSGLKMLKKFKLYVFVLIIRRTLFVISFVTCVSITSKYVIGAIAFLQLIYLGYICYLRPFKEFKDNFMEIMNESYFLLLLSSLIYLNTTDKWSSTSISIYIWVLQSDNLILINYFYVIKKNPSKIQTNQKYKFNIKFEIMIFCSIQVALKKFEFTKMKSFLVIDRHYLKNFQYTVLIEKFETNNQKN